MPRIPNVLFFIVLLLSSYVVLEVCPLQLKTVTDSSLNKRKLVVHEAPAPPLFQLTWFHVFKSLLDHPSPITVCGTLYLKTCDVIVY